MATKKKAPTLVDKDGSAVKFVTQEQLAEVTGTMSRILDLLEKKDEPRAEAPKLSLPPEKPVAPAVEKKNTAEEIAKASANANKERVPQEFEEKAFEILGDAIDHVELFYPRRGGSIFTVVVKKEKSNAAESYLQFYKEDRRSKDIGNDGIEGVEQWCRLIKSNLARPH